MVVIDTHPAGGGPRWPVPASTHENRASELMLAHLNRPGVAARLELVLVDQRSHRVRRPHARPRPRHRGPPDRAGRQAAGFRPIRHAWRVEVAHGRLGRYRRLAKSFENTTTSATGWLQVACIATTSGQRHGQAFR